MKDLKDIAPNLSKLEKKQPFEVPDNYFDDFPTKMQEKIAEKEEKSFNWNRLFTILKPQLSLIAGMFMVAIITYFVISGSISDTNKTTEVATTEEAQTNDALDYYLADMDEEFLIEAYIGENTTSDSISDEELFNYIADNVDTYTLIDNY